RIVNKRVLQGLTLAGGLDSFKGTRSQNYAVVEEALSFGSKFQSAKDSHSDSLFGDIDDSFNVTEPDLPNVSAWDTKQRLTKEREMLGFYLSDHPLSKFEREYRSFATIHLGEPDTFEGKEYVVAVGVINGFRTKMDRSNRNMAFFKLDDLTGSCECLMFSKNYQDYSECLIEESTVLVKGKIESSGDTIKLHVEEAYDLNDAKTKFTQKLLLYTEYDKHDEETVVKLKEVLENYSGSTPVYLCVKQNGSVREFYLDYKVKISNEMISKLTDLLGENGIRYLT
ncbi:MAG: DNA polymerase III subunit alpha, partial [Candidatus Pacebacteria bacterium]|nr:DNA polymerase III subunit alpha [Candidatus Paceibacterota bacterium]